MSFFGPISSPLLDESSAPMIRRALHRARVVGSFAFAQGAVQLIGFLSGILLVRHLDQREYAYFTIANTMQGTINVLADIGISIGLVSIGGRVWQDRRRFGQLIQTGMRLRRMLAPISIVIVTPILYLMLVKNGASTGYALALIGVVLGGLMDTVLDRCAQCGAAAAFEHSVAFKPSTSPALLLAWPLLPA